MPPDRDRLLATVEALHAIDRPSASPGERAAAEWICAALAAQGVAARLEEEPATGSFAVPVALREEPVSGVRAIVLSTGAEESFMEGMRGFVARHRAALDRARTRVVVLECLGGPEPIVIEGEGMLRMRDYAPGTRDWLAEAGERAGHPLRRGLRSGFATDALIALKAGLPTAVLAAIDEYKMAPNYHSARDVAANLDLGTMAACVEICAAAVRSLSGRGPFSARPAPAPV